MPPRGRKPRPSYLKGVSGNPGKRPINRDEPQPPVGLGDPPDDLTAGAKAIWSAEAFAWGTVADRAAFRIYCYNLDRCQRLEAAISDEGDYIPGSRGTLVQHPASRQLGECQDRIIRLCAEFGMTPSARTRVKVPDGPKRDPMHEHLDGRA